MSRLSGMTFKDFQDVKERSGKGVNNHYFSQGVQSFATAPQRGFHPVSALDV